MRAVQRLGVHLAVLLVVVVAAIYLWTRDKDSSSVVSDVTVWGGKPADVQRVVFESKTRKVEIESRKDEVGRYFEGTVTKQAVPPPKPMPQPDAGMDADGESGEAAVADPPAEVAAPTVVHIVSVKAAEKIAEAVAPLQAIREVGKVSSEQEKDFGLAEPEGTLTLTMGSNERSLIVGAAAPGGGDRYVRNAATEVVYAIRGDFLRDLMSGEAVLNERDMHGFEDDEVTGVRIVAGEKSREVIRSQGMAGAIWSDSEHQDKPDETLGTWMAKIARLRPTEFVQQMPGPAEGNRFIRLEYMGKKGSMGFLEIYRFALEDTKKSDWFIRTERTRKPAKVFAATAEQVEQDLGSVLP